ncbi:MAG: peptide deformylase [Candidatus Yonathbacteria bacterium]|nr:peptide deformylase [Candidatus Yonathbacteria bacterium]
MVTILQKEALVLREKAEPVNPKDFGSPRLKKILEDMVTALEKEEDGVAIAAPQIGVPLRIFVVSHRAFEFEDRVENAHNHDAQGANQLIRKRSNMVFINPVITKLSRKKVWLPEGCLSVRWLYGEVERRDKATVRAYDENGKAFTLGGSGLLAQIFQHETDHLNGVLFIDSARNVEKITAEEQRIRREESGNNKK